MRRKQARFERVKERYDEQLAAGHLTAAEVLLRQMLARAPEWAAGWFELGLIAKLRHDWEACRDANARALALGDGRPGDPAAWNLGIAATALGDEETAARAWATYGAGIPSGDRSLVPVRLNPAPRYPGQRPLLVDGTEHRPEIVWTERLGPAHGVVTTVPMPGSGHRYGDVVLHDGEPSGAHAAPDGASVPLFDEVARLSAGPHPTIPVLVTVPGEGDLAALLGALTEVGLPAEDWTASVREVCDECADGAPEAVRAPGEAARPPSERAAGEAAGEGTRPPSERAFGIAGQPDAAAAVLDGWAAAGSGREWRRSPGRTPAGTGSTGTG